MIFENFPTFFQQMRSKMLKIQGNPKGNCSLLSYLWTSSFNNIVITNHVGWYREVIKEGPQIWVRAVVLPLGVKRS